MKKSKKRCGIKMREKKDQDLQEGKADEVKDERGGKEEVRASKASWHNEAKQQVAR